MSTVGNWRGPNIVKDGLVLYLNAGSPNSFYSPTSGNTWKDISGNGYNGTLTNGPTYDSGNGGSILFDGSNDYSDQTIPYYSTFTIFIWLYPISGNGIFTYGNSGTTPIMLMDYDLSGNLRVYVSDYYQTLSSVLTMNSWNLITAVANQTTSTREVFVNAVSKGSNTYNVSSQIGTFKLGLQSFLGYGNCKISQVKFYNRVLTPSEILQNFNATKSRFGL